MKLYVIPLKTKKEGKLESKFFSSSQEKENFNLHFPCSFLFCSLYILFPLPQNVFGTVVLFLPEVCLPLLPGQDLGSTSHAWKSVSLFYCQSINREYVHISSYFIVHLELIQRYTTISQFLKSIFCLRRLSNVVRGIAGDLWFSWLKYGVRI